MMLLILPITLCLKKYIQLHVTLLLWQHRSDDTLFQNLFLSTT